MTNVLLFALAVIQLLGALGIVGGLLMLCATLGGDRER